jgi:hypothetical protein
MRVKMLKTPFYGSFYYNNRYYTADPSSKALKITDNTVTKLQTLHQNR